MMEVKRSLEVSFCVVFLFQSVPYVATIIVKTRAFVSLVLIHQASSYAIFGVSVFAINV